MSITVNPKTGLKEGYHEYYRVPIVYQRNINALRLNGMKEDRGVNPIGSRNFALYDGKNTGHGKITHEEFDYHYDEAMSFWREAR